MRQFDVFLSYHWRDHEQVEGLANWLRREAGLHAFLDRWYLAPGQRWQTKLEEVLGSCGAVAVCVGPGDMGAWQQREKELALDRQTRDATLPVIPVLLPGCDPVLGFLSQNTWVDLRGGLADESRLRALAKAIRREPPGAELEEEIAAAKAQICPYRGLRYFREEDAEFFFGREAASQALAQAVARSPLVAVVGASGSGKSSVVRAGLLPLLRRGFSERTWEMVTLVPSDRPLHQLAAALLPLLEPTMTEIDRLAEVGKLAQLLSNPTSGVSLRDVARRVLDKQPGTDRLLIAVDQWEELYTLTKDDGVRARFIEELLAATAAGDPIRVVLTLRGDFFGRALEHRPLSDRLEGNLVHLGPMTESELRGAIVEPARRVGLDLEPGLAEQLLRDVAGQPGNLPLLEFALEQLWKTRQGRVLSHDSYQDMGGLQGALAQRADNLLEQLSPVEREAVQRIFLQLVRVASASADTRRRAAIAEIGDPARPLLERLAAERLVVTGRDDATGQETAEVAHEALIRGWKRLREWVDADREFLLWRERLRTEIDTWQRLTVNERDVALLRGPLLTEAEQWLAKRGERLSTAEREFIRASQLARERAEDEERERKRQELERAQALAEAQRARAAEAEHNAARQRRAAAILSAVAILALALGLFAGLQWFNARQQARRSFARQLAAQALVSRDRAPELALLLAAQAVHVEQAPDTRSALLNVLQRHPFVPSTLRSSRSPVRNLAFSADGALLAASGADGESTTWNLATRVAVPPSGDREAPSLAATPGGRLAAMVRDGTLVVSDSVTRQTRTFPDGPDKVVAAALAPDGATVAAGHADGTIVLRDVETEREIGEPLLGHNKSVTALAFSRDGATLASGDDDGTILLWPVGFEAWKTRACRMAGRPLTPDEDKLQPGEVYELGYREVNGLLGNAPYEPACRPPRNTPETPAAAVSEADTVLAVPKDMVLIPGGWFWMGCNADVDKQCIADEAGHRVYVETFAIDRTEVTVADYRQCVEDHEACDEPGTSEFCNSAKKERDDHPVNCVDWFQSKKYCEWKGKRLPREAEWEKAARGRDGQKYPWGNDEFSKESKKWANIADETAKRELGPRIPFAEYAEGYDDGFATTARVGSFPEGASPYGALDMAGNVSEWVWDRTPGGRGLRGGSWYLNAASARPSHRPSGDPDLRYEDVGFRCAR